MQRSYPYWVKFGGVYYPPNTPIEDASLPEETKAQEECQASVELPRRRKGQAVKRSPKEE